MASFGRALALNDEEILRDFRFGFSAPGARAMGLGGAFVGVADDATAADANPAGLCNLSTGQVFLEYRYSGNGSTDAITSSVGSTTVNPVSGARDLPYLSLTSQSKADNTGSPDFIGFVWPLALGSKGNRLALSGSRQVVLSDHRSLDQTETRFAFESFPNTVPDTGTGVVAYSVTTPVSGSIAADVVYWNASAAYQVHPDFSIGLTVSYANLDVSGDSTTQVIDPLQLFVDPTHPRLPSQPAVDYYQSRIDGTDSGLAYSLGVQWHPVTPFQGGMAPWRFGAVYRKGVQFGVPETTQLNGLPDQSFQNDVVVPDRYSVGASYVLGKSWLFAAQLERIEYSDQLQGYRSGVNFFTSDRVAAGAYTVDPAKSVKFDVKDGTFFRFGAEYRVPLGKENQDLAVRAGYYLAPADRIYMSEFNSTDAKINAMYLNAFPEGDTSNHFTAGLGYAFGTSSVHLAIDASSGANQIVASYALIVGPKQKKK